MKHNTKVFSLGRIAMLLSGALLLLSQQILADNEQQVQFDTGYFMREDNQDTAAKTTGNSIYIKFYPDRWVAMLYVPYPYSTTLQPAVLHSIFAEVGGYERKSAFIRSKFGQLKEPAVVHLESWRMEEGKFLYDCGGQAPCTVTIEEESMVMVKKGIIGEHIIKFLRVAE